MPWSVSGTLCGTHTNNYLGVAHPGWEPSGAVFRVRCSAICKATFAQLCGPSRKAQMSKLYLI